MRFSALLLAFSLSAAPALAQQAKGLEWKVNDQTAPISPFQASKDGFGVLMLVTDDPQGFISVGGVDAAPCHHD